MYLESIAASCDPLASTIGSVAIGMTGPFFGSFRLSMLVMEKLVYGDPADLLASGGVFGGLNRDSML